jgi:protein-disulfide isomerase
MPRNKKSDSTEKCCENCQPKSLNLLYVMLGVITLFSVFLYIKVTKLEEKLAAGGGTTGTTAQVQQESPLSVINLKKYAKELGLNTSKFNKCLDSGEKKVLVDKSISYGTSVGVQGTPGFFINGKFLGGAFPFSAFKEIIDKEINGTGSTLCADYTEANLSNQCDATGTDQSKAFKPVAKDIDVSNMTAEGVKNAKVTIVEFSDFECPYCIRAYSTVKQILSVYKNDVKFYYKVYPLTNIHPNSEKAAEASLCAGDQGKFWEWHNKVFETEAKGQAQ